LFSQFILGAAPHGSTERLVATLHIAKLGKGLLVNFSSLRVAKLRTATFGNIALRSITLGTASQGKEPHFGGAFSLGASA